MSRLRGRYLKEAQVIHDSIFPLPGCREKIADLGSWKGCEDVSWGVAPSFALKSWADQDTSAAAPPCDPSPKGMTGLQISFQQPARRSGLRSFVRRHVRTTVRCMETERWGGVGNYPRNQIHICAITACSFCVITASWLLRSSRVLSQA